MGRFLTIATVAAGLLIAGCGGDDDESDNAMGGGATATETTAPAAAQPPAEAAPGAGTTIKTADSQYGDVLFDGEDQAIYYFDKESRIEERVLRRRAPRRGLPVLTEGDPRAGAGCPGRPAGHDRSGMTAPPRSPTTAIRSISTRTRDRTRSPATTSASSAACGWPCCRTESQ